MMARSAFVSKLLWWDAHWGQMVFPSKHCGGASHTSSARRPNRRRRRCHGEAEVNIIIIIIIQLCETRAGGRSREESRTPSPGAWKHTHTHKHSRQHNRTGQRQINASFLRRCSPYCIVSVFLCRRLPRPGLRIPQTCIKGKVRFNLRKLSEFSAEKSPARHVCSSFARGPVHVPPGLLSTWS